MTNRGKIHKLEYKSGKWNISKSFDLESEPQIYKIINEKQILIVTHIGIIIKENYYGKSNFNISKVKT